MSLECIYYCNLYVNCKPVKKQVTILRYLIRTVSLDIGVCFRLYKIKSELSVRPLIMFQIFQLSSFWYIFTFVFKLILSKSLLIIAVLPETADVLKPDSYWFNIFWKLLVPSWKGSESRWKLNDNINGFRIPVHVASSGFQKCIMTTLAVFGKISRN
jgi:hypothetical protein